MGKVEFYLCLTFLFPFCSCLLFDLMVQFVCWNVYYNILWGVTVSCHIMGHDLGYLCWWLMQLTCSLVQRTIFWELLRFLFSPIRTLKEPSGLQSSGRNTSCVNRSSSFLGIIWWISWQFSISCVFWVLFSSYYFSQD